MKSLGILIADSDNIISDHKIELLNKLPEFETNLAGNIRTKEEKKGDIPDFTIKK